MPIFVEQPILIGLIAASISVVVLCLVWSRNWRLFVRRFIAIASIFSTVAGVGIFVWGLWLASGTTTPTTVQLSPSVTYERVVVGSEAVGHLATVDLSDRCIALLVSDVASNGQVAAQKTEVWAQNYEAVVAMNASFFFPHVEFPPWDSYPKTSDTVTALGPIVVDGEEKGTSNIAPGHSWEGAVVYVDANNRAGIGRQFPEGTVWGVSGLHHILDAGEVQPSDTTNFARSIVATNGVTMWFLVVDGKQPGYSEGVTLADAAEFLLQRGATDALEMDGGGSATLASADSLLSRPIEQRMPGRSRVVATQIGVIDACASTNPER